MNTQTFRIFIFSFLLGCKTSPTAPHDPIASQQDTLPVRIAKSELQESTIDIQYSLGKDRYRFIAVADGRQVTGNTFLNKQVLEKRQIDEKRYPDFLKKVSQFIHDVQRTPAQAASCKNPFTISVKIGTLIHKVKGCRSTDGGALSRLVRDGEYLLFSHN